MEKIRNFLEEHELTLVFSSIIFYMLGYAFWWCWIIMAILLVPLVLN